MSNLTNADLSSASKAVSVQTPLPGAIDTAIPDQVDSPAQIQPHNDLLLHALNHFKVQLDQKRAATAKSAFDAIDADFEEIATLSQKIFYITSAAGLALAPTTRRPARAGEHAALADRDASHTLSASERRRVSDELRAQHALEHGYPLKPRLYQDSGRSNQDSDSSEQRRDRSNPGSNRSNQGNDPQGSISLDEEAEGTVTKAAKRAFRKHWRRYLALHLCAALALIVPMLIMSIDPSLVKSLVTSSVFIVVVAVGIALSSYFGDKESVTATAAYAGVLFVFVGASLG